MLAFIDVRPSSNEQDRTLFSRARETHFESANRGLPMVFCMMKFKLVNNVTFDRGGDFALCTADPKCLAITPLQ